MAGCPAAMSSVVVSMTTRSGAWDAPRRAMIVGRRQVRSPGERRARLHGGKRGVHVEAVRGPGVAVSPGRNADDPESRVVFGEEPIGALLDQPRKAAADVPEPDEREISQHGRETPAARRGLPEQVERARQVGGIRAEAYPQVSVHLEVVARHDEQAFLVAQALDERGRVDGMVIPHERDGARVGRRVRHPDGALFGPAPDDRVVGADDAARAGDQLAALRRCERDARESIAHGAGRDAGVVVHAPERLDVSGGPVTQPMRSPGSPYAFDRPLVTSTRS
jgi:hypothetical protein